MTLPKSKTIFPILIFADKSRVGKDHAAKRIVQVLAQHDISARHFAIADNIKDFCEVHFNTHPRQHYEEQPELRKQLIGSLNVQNVVELWIKVGSFFRDLDPYYWIERLLPPILKYSKYDCFVPVISDYRFDNEYNCLDAMFDCTTLKVKCDKGEKLALDGHITLSPDYEVTNYFDESFDKILETFCNEFINTMEIKNNVAR